MRNRSTHVDGGSDDDSTAIVMVGWIDEGSVCMVGFGRVWVWEGLGFGVDFDWAPRFGGKKFKIEIDSSIWREAIQNRNRLLDLAGRNSK